jgi:hypothetical protein
MTIALIIIGTPILTALFLLGLFKLEKAASDETYL